MLWLFGRPDWGVFVEVIVGIDGVVVVVVGFFVSATLTACLGVEGA